MPGNIIFKPIQANLLHNTDFITKMNPYCAFVVGEQRIKSEVCKKGGKHPHWTDSVTIPVSNEHEIKVEVMDKDRFTHDDQIGAFSVNLQEVESQGHTSRWYPLFYKDKLAGEILLEALFEGSTGLLNEPQQIVPLEKPLEVISEEKTSSIQPELVQEEKIVAVQPDFVEQEKMTAYSGPVMQKQETFTQSVMVGRDALPTQQMEQLHIQGASKYTSLSEESRRVFIEQKQSVEPHKFMKEVDVVETRPVVREIEVFEPHKVMREVQYTETVPVKKQIETVEAKVVTKEVEVIEPRLITKEIQVLENVPVMRKVEVIESIPVVKEIETYEPQTFTKTIEVTEHVPVKKQVTVTEPVHFKKPIEFVEPIITTQTIIKEVQPAIIIDEIVKKELGPASVINDSSLRQSYYSTELETRRSEQQFLAQESMARYLTGSQYDYQRSSVQPQLISQTQSQKQVQMQ